ncbi:hypothetical protein QYE76_052592 [Lolium multiflorum]|uniref:Uncharacterized protein n=1 Tax=Lolium multiflorum TaxID=4521 RepID=A0AAD8WL66_LOLMU|nr:hypothetical protein QYE76_052592 [Lolium multiflorum]
MLGEVGCRDVGDPRLQEGRRPVLRQAYLQAKGTALHYELHKNIALQRRVTLGQAESIQTLKSENAELNRQLADAQEPAILIPRIGDETDGGGAKEEQAEKQLAEKNSELIREKGEFLLKRNADSETIKRQQKELNGLRKYMETAEHHWDLLTENILEPLGYPEKRRNLFPRDDLLTLAGDDCKDLISASRKICHNLSLKNSRTCGLRKLVKKMDILPELVTDLQASCPRCSCNDLDYTHVSGYDTRIARRIRHEEFYDKVVLPADEPLETNFKKSVTRKPDLRNRDSVCWTSSKDAPQEEPKDSAAASDEDEESEEDVSSPAEGAKEKDPEGNASPSKEE